MGEGPIGWADMAAWQSLTGIELDAWEARTIRRLSQAFVAQRHESEKPGCPSPCEEPAEAVNDRVTAQFKAMFDALAQRPLPPGTSPGRAKAKVSG